MNFKKNVQSEENPPMEKFLLKLDLGKMCLLGSSSTVQLVPAPSLSHHCAKFVTINMNMKGA